jgi:hypothetical protein
MSEPIMFKVWWIPQVPMKSFQVQVCSVEEGRKICDVLAAYGLFQYQNNIKPDYANAGGLVFSAAPISEHGDDWIDVPDADEEWADYLREIDEHSKAEAQS